MSSSNQQGWDICSKWEHNMLATLQSRLFKSSRKQNISAYQYQQNHTRKKSHETVQWALAHANDLLYFWAAWDWKGSPSVAAVHHPNIWNGRVGSTSSCEGTCQKSMDRPAPQQPSTKMVAKMFKNLWNPFPLSEHIWDLYHGSSRGGQLMSHKKKHAPPCIFADFNTPSLK